MFLSKMQNTSVRFDDILVSVAVLAKISLRSPQKVFIFIIKNIYTGSKYPKVN